MEKKKIRNVWAMQVMSLIKNGSPEAPVSSQPHTCVSTLFKSNSRSLLITFCLVSPTCLSLYTGKWISEWFWWAFVRWKISIDVSLESGSHTRKLIRIARNATRESEIVSNADYSFHKCSPIECYLAWIVLQCLPSSLSYLLASSIPKIIASS